MQQYLEVVQTVLKEGVRKENRTGVDTLSTFNINYQHDLADGFPLLTTKRVSWKNIVIENLWFLSGDTNTAFLEKHGVNFWKPWQDEQGEVSSGYGRWWRRFPVSTPKARVNDQVTWVLGELQRNPTSRRLVVSAWSPENAQTNPLPPCHCFFVLNVQNFRCAACCGDGWVYSHSYSGAERDGCSNNCQGRPTPRLCLHLTQRSCDVALGVPYNLAGYAFILELFSRFSGFKPGIFAHTLVDAHVYTSKPDGSLSEYDHIPGLREQLSRNPKTLPRLVIADNIQSLEDVLGLLEADTSTIMDHFKLEGYESYPALGFKVAV